MKSDPDKSVLARFTGDHYHAEPYPFLWIENALDEDLYEELSRTFPTPREFRASLRRASGWWRRRSEYRLWLKRLKLENRRTNISYSIAHRDSKLPEVWKQFLAQHTSAEFLEDLLGIFAEPIKQHYPDLALPPTSVGRRWIDTGCDFFLDALIAINTPTRNAGSVTVPHTDNPDKLFAGMLYFRDPQDGGGGDLLIYKRTTAPTREDVRRPNVNDLEEVYRIPYRANSLVLMLNSGWSVHDVSIRHPSRFPRRFVNFVVEHSHPLF